MSLCFQFFFTAKLLFTSLLFILIIFTISILFIQKHVTHCDRSLNWRLFSTGNSENLYINIWKYSDLCVVLKGHSDPDSERHESDQTPWWLDSDGQFTLLSSHCGALRYNLSAWQRDNSHLGQTHPGHHNTACPLEGKWWGLISHLFILGHMIIYFELQNKYVFASGVEA